MAVINLSTVKGPIDQYLQSLIAHTNTIEVIILTNIYSSQRNKNIWFRITMCQAFPLSLDLFKMGILFTKIKFNLMKYFKLFFITAATLMTVFVVSGRVFSMV